MAIPLPDSITNPTPPVPVPELPGIAALKECVPSIPDLPTNVDSKVSELFPDVANDLKAKTTELEALKDSLSITEIEYADGIAAIGAISACAAGLLSGDKMKKSLNAMVSSSMTAKMLGNQPEFESVDSDMDPLATLQPDTDMLTATSAMDLATDPSKVTDITKEIDSTDLEGKASAVASSVQTAVGGYASRAMISQNLGVAKQLNPNFQKLAQTVSPGIPFPEVEIDADTNREVLTSKLGNPDNLC
jgi:hypothetical protein